MAISSDALVMLILILVLVLFDVASLMWSVDSRETHPVLTG